MSRGWMEQALANWRETRAPEALGGLLKAQRDRAFAVAWHLTRTNADAEDVVQEAFLKLLSRTAGLETVAAFETSLYRAVVQCALDALRKRTRLRDREVAGPAGKAEVNVYPGRGGVEREPELEERRTLLRMAVADLKEQDRLAVILCYYQGLSVTQAAQVLELPRPTVQTRLARALCRLRESLKRRGLSTTHSAILALLWADGGLSAPDSLCRSLDGLLPGEPCQARPALERPGSMASVSPLQLAGGWALAHPLATLLLLAIGAGSCFWNWSQSAVEASSTSPAAGASALPRLEAKNETPGRHLAPAAGTAERIAAPTQAEPAPAAPVDRNLAGLIDRIEGRRSEKAAAQVRAIQAYAERASKGEEREVRREGWWKDEGQRIPPPPSQDR